MIFYWILLLVSGVALGWIFWRRSVLTSKSLKFEEELKRDEERAESKSEEDEIPLEDLPSDLQLKRQAEQRAREEKTRRIREAKKAFKKADVHFAKGDYGLAEKYLLQVLSFDNDHLDANLKLGLLYLHQENLSRSEFFFQKLIDLKENPVYFSNLALVLFQQNRMKEAAKLYEKAIELDNKKPSRFVSLAHVYQELGELEKAMRMFEEASRLDPRNLDYLWTLADYYEKFSRIGDAIRVLKKLLELDPYNTSAQGKLVILVEGEEAPEEEEPTGAEEEEKSSTNE